MFIPQDGQERFAELCRSGQLLLLCGRSGRADNRDFESNRWQWKDGAWSHQLLLYLTVARQD
jgi:hypothetical protein